MVAKTYSATSVDSWTGMGVYWKVMRSDFPFPWMIEKAKSVQSRCNLLVVAGKEVVVVVVEEAGTAEGDRTVGVIAEIVIVVVIDVGNVIVVAETDRVIEGH